jgi:hypothetical protein
MKKVQFADREFQRASFCEEEGDQCVRVAKRSGVVALRDSKNTEETTLYFDREEWIAFIAGVKAGEFDL